MGRPIQEDYVFYEGERFTIEFYFTQNGEMPAKAHFELAEEQIKLKLIALVKHMADVGKIFDERKFRIVDHKEKIYEFKPREERFFNFFYEGRKIIITNGYRKHGQKVNPRELSKAINFKMDYEYRVKGGVYYESN